MVKKQNKEKTDKQKDNITHIIVRFYEEIILKMLFKVTKDEWFRSVTGKLFQMTGPLCRKLAKI